MEEEEQPYLLVAAGVLEVWLCLLEEEEEVVLTPYLQEEVEVWLFHQEPVVVEEQLFLTAAEEVLEVSLYLH